MWGTITCFPLLCPTACPTAGKVGEIKVKECPSIHRISGFGRNPYSNNAHTEYFNTI